MHVRFVVVTNQARPRISKYQKSKNYPGGIEMGVTTSKWDISEYLDNPKMIREYLIAALLISLLKLRDAR
ncbi:MAG: hypothetical protein ACQETR_01935 [Thermodesulfobacteriota bacterium]